MAVASQIAVSATNVVTGGILVHSIYKLKQFMSQMSEEDVVNMTAITQHALAFGLYIASFIINIVFFILQLIDATRNELETYKLSATGMVICSFSS